MDDNCFILLQNNSVCNEMTKIRDMSLGEGNGDWSISEKGLYGISVGCQYEPGKGIIIDENVIFREDEFEQFYVEREHYDDDYLRHYGKQFVKNASNGIHKYYFLCTPSTEGWSEERFCGKKDSILIKTDNITITRPNGDNIFIPLGGMHVHIYIAKENHIKPAR